jgi:hypothetical protein
MRRLEIRVRLVQRMTLPISRKVMRRGRTEIADAGQVGIALFVDIVAELQDEVGLGRDDIAVHAEARLLPMLARCHRQPQPIGDTRHRHRPAHRTRRSQGVEAIPIGSSRRQPRDLDMHGMCPLGMRQTSPGAKNPPKLRIRRDLIADCHRPRL